MTTDRELADRVEEWLHGRELQYATIKLMADVIYALRRSQPDDERAYQMLEAYGVPRERAKSVANGIDVLGTRFGKEIVALRERQPEGEMVMVPREPTEAMFLTLVPHLYGRPVDIAHARVLYRAMLTAAEAEGRKP